MKILTYILTIFLIFGLLGVPGGVFAQETSSTGYNILQSSNSVIDNTVPLLKGGGGGGRGGSSSGFKSSSSKSSSSKKIHDDDDDTTGGSSGGFWIIAIIFLVVFLGLIGFLVWFFFLRK